MWSHLAGISELHIEVDHQQAIIWLQQVQKNMGFLGILEDHKLSHVPATVILSEEQTPIDGTTTGLKRGTGKDAEIILIPQP